MSMYIRIISALWEESTGDLWILAQLTNNVVSFRML